MIVFPRRVDPVTLAAIVRCKAVFIEFAAGRYCRETDERLRRLFEAT